MPTLQLTPKVVFKHMYHIFCILKFPAWHGIHIIYATGGRTCSLSIRPVRNVVWRHQIGRKSYKTAVLPTCYDYCQFMGHYRVALINRVPPRPNYGVCPGTHLSPTFFLYTA